MSSENENRPPGIRTLQEKDMCVGSVFVVSSSYDRVHNLVVSTILVDKLGLYGFMKCSFSVCHMIWYNFKDKNFKFVPLVFAPATTPVIKGIIWWTVLCGRLNGMEKVSNMAGNASPHDLEHLILMRLA
ncbi:uncharacterized protein LOC126665411 isoform X2 [Mercurialis annua]|uniref:uncharacterized protein LOC126665411 isoform X2 n=1 Tax=Mercurialis annua TaxID=3986 RepID=UPI0024AFC906|nr:uncharacterized protein LOC126665411 isoform X2 [Mercurialis annua]